MRLGTAVHEALKKKVGHPEKDWGEVFSLEDFADYQRGRDMLERFDLPTGEILGLEERFEFPLGGHILTGVIDRIEKIEGEVVITDYKTSSYLPTEEELRDHLQPSVYLIAKPNASFRYYYLAYGMILDVSRSPEDLKRAREYILSMADKIEKATEFPAIPHRFCSFCSLHDSCRELRKFLQRSPAENLVEAWEDARLARRISENKEERLESLLMKEIELRGPITAEGKTYFLEPWKQKKYDVSKLIGLLSEKKLLNLLYIRQRDIPRDRDLFSALREAEYTSYGKIRVKVVEKKG